MVQVFFFFPQKATATATKADFKPRLNHDFRLNHESCVLGLFVLGHIFNYSLNFMVCEAEL